MAFGHGGRDQGNGERVNRVFQKLHEGETGLFGAGLGELDFGDDPGVDQGAHCGLVGRVASHQRVEHLDRQQTVQDQNSVRVAIKFPPTMNRPGVPNSNVMPRCIPHRATPQSGVYSLWGLPHDSPELNGLRMPPLRRLVRVGSLRAHDALRADEFTEVNSGERIRLGLREKVALAVATPHCHEQVSLPD